MPIFHHSETSTASPVKSNSDGSGNDGHNSDDSEWRDHRMQDIRMHDTSPRQGSTSDYNFSPSQIRNRDELIRSIKRGKSPTWAHEDVESNPRDHLAGPNKSYYGWSLEQSENRDDSPSNVNREDALYTSERPQLAHPDEIERPRSALHSGDFREGATPAQAANFPDFGGFDPSARGPPSFKRFGSSPTTPWFNHATASRFTSKENDLNTSTEQVKSILNARSRAPSLGSFSSSYVLKAPTSPLVHQANNTDLDFSPKYEPGHFSTENSKSNRRRTLPPETFMQFRGSPPAQTRHLNLSRSFASVHGSEDSRHQAYQPHRSVGYSLQPASSPQTPFRFRRPSFASDLSPRIHASMVGSYEESILRGRMSTTPSKPLDFTAQIGVLGKGKCRSALRCPPHITVPFPAVFYSYPTSGAGRSISDDNPSPYVGLMDLENALPRDNSSEKRRTRDQKITLSGGTSRSSTPIPGSELNEHRKREKRSSRSDAVKAPPGGSYRIPQRGQLQIVIKNPNKTAVKLFLVPYDLDDMEPGTKTFIRQRSYSAGPIIDMPLTARKNFGTDRPEASLNPTNDPKDKPTLRYLIHLNICCTGRGRFYLHSTIRVVFANRVPDGKEKLRNEIQLPEPRYSPYKPTKERNNSTSHSSAAMDKNYRRRSAGVGFAGSQFFDDKHPPNPSSPYHQLTPPSSSTMHVTPVPFKLSVPKSRESSVGDADTSLFTNNNFWQTSNYTSPAPAAADDDMSLDPPPPPASAGPQYSSSEETNNQMEIYSNFRKGDVTSYGSNSSPTSPRYSSVGESLLAQKLRDWNCNSEQ